MHCCSQADTEALKVALTGDFDIFPLCYCPVLICLWSTGKACQYTTIDVMTLSLKVTAYFHGILKDSQQIGSLQIKCQKIWSLRMADSHHSRKQLRSCDVHVNLLWGVTTPWGEGGLIEIRGAIGVAQGRYLRWSISRHLGGFAGGVGGGG